VFYRRDRGTIWILRNTAGRFGPVYSQGDPGDGIGGYDLNSVVDRVFAFDYNGSGKLDHLVLYRPGCGAIWILRNTTGKFEPVYAQGDPGEGIGGHCLRSQDDRAFAFDYNSSGRLDRNRLGGYAARKRVGEAEALFAEREIDYEPVELTSRVDTSRAPPRPPRCRTRRRYRPPPKLWRPSMRLARFSFGPARIASYPGNLLFGEMNPPAHVSTVRRSLILPGGPGPFFASGCVI
jgi:hypothetical protein